MHHLKETTFDVFPKTSKCFLNFEMFSPKLLEVFPQALEPLVCLLFWHFAAKFILFQDVRDGFLGPFRSTPKIRALC